MEKMLLWKSSELMGKTVFWKIMQNPHNNTCAGLQVFRGERLFYGISLVDYLWKISSWRTIHKIIEKLPGKHLWISLVLHKTWNFYKTRSYQGCFPTNKFSERFFPKKHCASSTSGLSLFFFKKSYPNTSLKACD